MMYGARRRFDVTYVTTAVGRAGTVPMITSGANTWIRPFLRTTIRIAPSATDAWLITFCVIDMPPGKYPER